MTEWKEDQRRDNFCDARLKEGGKKACKGSPGSLQLSVLPLVKVYILLVLIQPADCPISSASKPLLESEGMLTMALAISG